MSGLTWPPFGESLSLSALPSDISSPVFNSVPITRLRALHHLTLDQPIHTQSFLYTGYRLMLAGNNVPWLLLLLVIMSECSVNVYYLLYITLCLLPIPCLIVDMMFGGYLCHCLSIESFQPFNFSPRHYSIFFLSCEKVEMLVLRFPHVQHFHLHSLISMLLTLNCFMDLTHNTHYYAL